MLWELLPLSRNPIGLVEIKGVSKRQRKPFVMTVDQFHAVVAKLEEPYREMVQVAMCLGLRVSEVLALKWSDFDFDQLCLMVTRKAVHGCIDTVKTEYSEDELPLDSSFVDFLLGLEVALSPRKPGKLGLPLTPIQGQVYQICLDHPAGLHPFCR